MQYENNKKIITKRVAQIFQHGDVVNLGIGIPAAVAGDIPNDRTIILHSENGFLGMGPAPTENINKDLTDAGGNPSSILPGGCFFDSSIALGMMRGGHLDYTVIGFLEVDQTANIANYKVPGKMVPGMGGAMDLVAGAKCVIAVGHHLDKTGDCKLKRKCTLPLTGVGKVSIIVTDAAYFTFNNGKFVLEEVFAPYTKEFVLGTIDADIEVSPNFKIVEV